MSEQIVIKNSIYQYFVDNGYSKSAKTLLSEGKIDVNNLGNSVKLDSLVNFHNKRPRDDSSDSDSSSDSSDSDSSDSSDSDSSSDSSSSDSSSSDSSSSDSSSSDSSSSDSSSSDSSDSDSSSSDSSSSDSSSDSSDSDSSDSDESVDIMQKRAADMKRKAEEASKAAEQWTLQVLIV